MKWNLLRIVILILQFMLTNGESCSASTPTVKVVNDCPTTAKEWADAAAIKKCHRMENHNCKSFEYHCVMNQHEDGFIEVCAPTWFMSGFCAMFNADEERVIDNFDMDCTTFPDRLQCPSRFISTDAHKYQQCYNHVRNKTRINLIQVVQNDGEKKDEKSHTTEINTWLIVAVVVLAVFSIGAVIMLVFIRLQIIWKKGTDTTSTEMEPEKETLLHGGYKGMSTPPTNSGKTNTTTPQPTVTIREVDENAPPDFKNDSEAEKKRIQEELENLRKRNHAPNLANSQKDDMLERKLQTNKEHRQDNEGNQNDSSNISSMDPDENIDDERSSNNPNNSQFGKTENMEPDKNGVTTNPSIENSSNPAREGESCTDRNTRTVENGTGNRDVQHDETETSDDANSVPSLESTHGITKKLNLGNRPKPIKNGESCTDENPSTIGTKSDNSGIQKDETRTADGANSASMPSREFPAEFRKGNEIQNIYNNGHQESMNQGGGAIAPEQHTAPDGITRHPKLGKFANPIRHGESYTDQNTDTDGTGTCISGVQQTATVTSDDANSANVPPRESTNAPIGTNREMTVRERTKNFEDRQ